MLDSAFFYVKGPNLLIYKGTILDKGTRMASGEKTK